MTMTKTFRVFHRIIRYSIEIHITKRCICMFAKGEHAANIQQRYPFKSAIQPVKAFKFQKTMQYAHNHVDYNNKNIVFFFSLYM